MSIQSLLSYYNLLNVHCALCRAGLVTRWRSSTAFHQRTSASRCCYVAFSRTGPQPTHYRTSAR